MPVDRLWLRVLESAYRVALASFGAGNAGLEFLRAISSRNAAWVRMGGKGPTVGRRCIETTVTGQPECRAW